MSPDDLERFEQINSLISRAWNPMDRRVGTCCFMGHYRRRGHKAAHSDEEGGGGGGSRKSVKVSQRLVDYAAFAQLGCPPVSN